MELKDTLNLPKTQFPMRGNLVQREPERLKHWESIDLYQKIQNKTAGGEAFILHDGPPFTNGNVHIGTALNKILKDSILRFKNLQGKRAPYVPGWDCHGLPIEHKVARELREQKQDLEPAALREKCAEFSASFIETQRGQFKRLGVLADWEREYKTMNPAYEATILRTFAEFVEKGIVYRSKKPVYWSIPCETALAEAEIEYQDHVSPSIWVKFAIKNPEVLHLPTNASVVIWTTTPWTLPANLAVAVHPQLTYVVIAHGDQNFIVAEALSEDFLAKAELEGATISQKISGEELSKLIAKHPFIDRDSPIVLADYVTTEAGTGCVHTAPGHGLEDYLTGLKYNLEIYCPLDDKGCYVDDGQVPAELVGTTVLETNGKCPANIAVLQILEREGALVKMEKFRHQYPHCWRSKTPVVFRAMDQWFVSLDAHGHESDGHSMREKVLEAIGKVEWLPDWGENRIRGAVESRPDWCISRQRAWGVPIPAFYDEDGNALLDAHVIRKLAEQVEQDGTAIWWTKDASELVSVEDLPPEFAGKTLKKGMDTLDVWIDSGCSHRAVLQAHEDLNWPADLYLEGSDQHRGWFQSSIWTGVIADGAAPYRTVLTHGFIVDEKGEKISKSKGAMSSDGWVEEFGADIVRLWVASQDFRGDIRLSKNHFKLVSNVYRGVRNTLRFQLGNLHDFDPAKDAVPFNELEPLDQWALWRTQRFITALTEAYERYEFHRVYQEIDRFVGVTLSRLYHDILKDRLYTYGPDWKERRSAQTAIRVIFESFVKAIAPILTFTADEAWAFYKNDSDLSDASIHLESWPTIAEDSYDTQTVEDIENLLDHRDAVNTVIERQREAKVIGQNLDAAVTIKCSGAQYELFQKYASYLPELFVVSVVSVELLESEQANFEIEVQPAETLGLKRCPRSWRWVDKLVPAGEFGEVSERDAEALKSLQFV